MDTSGQYTAPVIEDYGNLVAVTAAIDFAGPEDGGSKMLAHHDEMLSGPLSNVGVPMM